MKQRFFAFFFILNVLSLFKLPLEAARTRSFQTQSEAKVFLETHYALGSNYYNSGKWKAAIQEFRTLIHAFPGTEIAADASYFLGASYYEIQEYDLANNAFSNYIATSSDPLFFEDAVQFKFCIAEHFKRGKKTRPFKMCYLPKWCSAQDSALTIYDEVVAALPNHPLAARALYSKGQLLKQSEEFREAVDTYQVLIRRFPKHDLVPTCYHHIADIYLEQSRYEFQNPDILALAELNSRKFQEEFPRAEQMESIEQKVSEIKELYAQGLCDQGLFYERMKQFDSASIYFQSAIEEFPDTKVADYCRARLASLQPDGEEVTPPAADEDSQDMGQAEENAEENEESETPAVGAEEENSFAQAEEESQSAEEVPQEETCQEMPVCEERPTQPYREQWPEGQEWEVPYCEEEVNPEYIHYSLLKKKPQIKTKNDKNKK